MDPNKDSRLSIDRSKLLRMIAGSVRVITALD